MANCSSETHEYLNKTKTKKLAIEAEVSASVCKICKCTYFVLIGFKLSTRKTTNIHEKECYICVLKFLFCTHQKCGASQVRKHQGNLVYTLVIHF